MWPWTNLHGLFMIAHTRLSIHMTHTNNTLICTIMKFQVSLRWQPLPSGFHGCGYHRFAHELSKFTLSLCLMDNCMSPCNKVTSSCANLNIFIGHIHMAHSNRHWYVLQWNSSFHRDLLMYPLQTISVVQTWSSHFLLLMKLIFVIKSTINNSVALYVLQDNHMHHDKYKLILLHTKRWLARGLFWLAQTNNYVEINKRTKLYIFYYYVQQLTNNNCVCSIYIDKWLETNNIR